MTTVYVESNFVLEIALGQEQSDVAEEILARAERGEIELAVPSFSLAEPFSTVVQRRRSRRRLVSQLNDQVGEIARSIPHREDLPPLQGVPAVMARIDRRETEVLVATVGRLLAASTVLPIDAEIYRQALDYRLRYGFSEQDGIIFASILGHLVENARPGLRVFVTKNWRDFSGAALEQQLKQHRCALLGSFAAAASVLGQLLSRPTGGAGESA